MDKKRRLAGTLVLAAGFLVLLAYCDSGTHPAAPGLESGSRIIEPDSGEEYATGDTLRIRWVMDSCTQVVVKISFDRGRTYKTIGGTSVTDSTWGDFRWAISDSLFGVPTRSDSCMVAIQDYFVLVPLLRSRGTFAIR